MRIRTPAPLKPLKRQIGLVLLHGRLLLKAMKKSAKLPPGELDSTDREMHTDRHYVIKKAKKLGPIFKTMWNGRYTTCVVGHSQTRRLLATNENTFPDETTDLTSLFPIGALRGMVGEQHQKYRRIFIQALQGTPLGAHEVVVQGWIRDRLEALHKAYPGQAIPGAILKASLRELTAGIMARLLYGVVPGSAEYAALVSDHRQFGPEAPVKKIERIHAEAFALIKQRLAAMVERIRREPDATPPSFIKQMVQAGTFDKTSEGNLIYLFESSHFDTYSLWRWILHFLAVNFATADRVRLAPSGEARALCQAIVYETLRLEQSEVLYRTPIADVVFEKYLIPKGSIMRGCLWEGHKDEKTFPDPFTFDPNRFLRRDYAIEEYAPFGLDKTRCIGANLVIDLSTLFVETLLTNFTITLATDGPPVFGAYHWEPNPEFSIMLAPVAKAEPVAVRA